MNEGGWRKCLVRVLFALGFMSKMDTQSAMLCLYNLENCNTDAQRRNLPENAAENWIIN